MAKGFTKVILVTITQDQRCGLTKWSECSKLSSAIESYLEGFGWQSARFS